MATKKKEALRGPSISGEHLAGKVVILREDYFKPEYRHIDRRFKCSGGFGCDPNLAGTAVFGTFLADGEEARVSRGDILCFAPACPCCGNLSFSEDEHGTKELACDRCGLPAGSALCQSSTVPCA